MSLKDAFWIVKGFQFSLPLDGLVGGKQICSSGREQE